MRVKTFKETLIALTLCVVLAGAVFMPLYAAWDTKGMLLFPMVYAALLLLVLFLHGKVLR